MYSGKIAVPPGGGGIVIVSLSEGANIVGIFVFPSKSHFATTERLLKRLAEKGHYIDVVTHFPSEEAPPR
jgi:glucuronosyltransferase